MEKVVPVGGTFKYLGKTFKAVGSNGSCSGCFFEDKFCLRVPGCESGGQDFIFVPVGLRAVKSFVWKKHSLLAKLKSKPRLVLPDEALTLEQKLQIAGELGDRVAEKRIDF